MAPLRAYAEGIGNPLVMECYAVDFGVTSCTVTGLVNGVRNAFTVKVAYGGRA